MVKTMARHRARVSTATFPGHFFLSSETTKSPRGSRFKIPRGEALVSEKARPSSPSSKVHPCDDGVSPVQKEPGV
jgi:hypothetical protein